MFVPHRIHTYMPPLPVTAIVSHFYVYMMFVPHRIHTYRPAQPVTEIALLSFTEITDPCLRLPLPLGVTLVRPYRNKRCRPHWDVTFIKIINNPIVGRRQDNTPMKAQLQPGGCHFESRISGNGAISEYPLHWFQTFLLTLVWRQPLRNKK
jgi:hypothetical protein